MGVAIGYARNWPPCPNLYIVEISKSVQWASALASTCMHVVVQKCTFAISSPDEFLSTMCLVVYSSPVWILDFHAVIFLLLTSG